MSLPPGFLDELRSRTSMAQVAGRKLVWDQRKSNQAKGDWWAPCPFHQEKTASFHVDDRKGYYYCFGCHAKGDAISFVRETENVGFMEAVEILAGEAGMQMPARDPKAKEKADRISQLADVMEVAVRHFRLGLATSAGSNARDYLEGRGLNADTQARFEIGFAQDAWRGLWDDLTQKGVAEELILDAGLAKPSQKGGRPYDTFRNRIIFPIRDPRGRCIAFGGRAMDPTDSAKYLNSPETALFDKGRSLYNHGPAREAAGKGAPLLVAEGYMDVIALSEAGFGATVAPLGTAITEDQLNLLWRIAPEPVIALDGDAAGLRAAMRAIDLALPLLEAGKSLRFCLMPAGQDPDDVIRAGGQAAMQALLDKAQPMVDLLWRRETDGKDFDSPERRAALDKSLKQAIGLIRDPSIRSHYGAAIKERRETLFGYRPTGGGTASQPGGWRRKRAETPAPSTKASLLAAEAAAVGHLREAVVLATLVRHPGLIPDFEGDLDDMECADANLARVRDELLRAPEGTIDAEAHLQANGCGAALESLFAPRHVQIAPSVRADVDEELARTAVVEELAKLSTRHGWAREVAEAAEDIAGFADEGLTWRLGQAAEAVNRAERAVQEDKTEYDVADNGARISRAERSELDALIDRISTSNQSRRGG